MEVCEKQKIMQGVSMEERKMAYNLTFDLGY
jgi:hypothetical protein